MQRGSLAFLHYDNLLGFGAAAFVGYDDIIKANAAGNMAAPCSLKFLAETFSLRLSQL